MRSIVEEKSESSEYPKLMICENKMIILFSERHIGTVVDEGERHAWKLGVHGRSWDMEQFTPFHGKVTLISE